ncbi:hypothetical protein AB0L40_18520 [Patulibacter sp. NPDC049589]|uniref:hypothetical protein n=1 Tax=Patulibacter sp. NPDC049589 TaxID=3154731 RepID=UPI00343E51F7
MAQRTTLNERQVDVLRWIADGCTDRDFDGVSARISAGALRNRDLVQTTGSGTSWKATITKAGREYLKRVDGPDPPAARQPNVSVTQQLVDDVIAAGGTLRVPIKTWQNPDHVDYERRAQLAQRHRKVPAGKRLHLSSHGNELEIQLIDAPNDGPAARVGDRFGLSPQAARRAA